uniref:Protein FAR1-related sequence 6 n=1 Tax=Tanacetum cinerariifolium TaxID=118510 RepID=A0A6L2NXA0_TANCI|nr:protein FAR1-related sequence 6 [Tanacetum cinerariifolium]
MEVNVIDLNHLDSDILSFMDITNIAHDSSSLNTQHLEPSNVRSSLHPLSVPSSPHPFSVPSSPHHLSVPSSPDTTQQVCTTNIPNLGMKFETEEELQLYFQEYAYQVGFEIRRTSVRTEGDKKYYGLACSKRGVHKPKSQSSRIRLSSKTGCMVKVNVIVNLNGKCIISCVSLEHNHVLSPKKSQFHRSHRKLDSYSKRILELNDHAGISLNKNFHSLVVEANGYENLPFGERDCRNYISKVRRLRRGAGDVEALRDYFVKMQRRNARLRAAYESFGDVVTFDSTYLTNKSSMPFAPFVGVNHHGQSILFGCGLISGEDAETYVWFFKSWLACMNGHPPKSIITGQCRTMQVVVAEIFPESYHRLCLWHIMKKIPEKLGAFKEYKSIKKTLKSLVYESLDPQEFRDRWSKMIEDEMIEDHSLEKNEWHMVKFLIEKDVKEIPSRYILSRWRKDVKHRYNFITNCYDDLKSGDQVKQFDHLCANFYKAANIVDSPKKYEYLMKCLDEAKEKLIDASSWGVNHVSNENELLPPWKIRGRGRPPKRKKSTIEKLTEKQE